MAPPNFINTFLDSPILIAARDRDYALFVRWVEDRKERVPARSLVKFRAWHKQSEKNDLDILDPGMYPALYDVLPRVAPQKEVVDAVSISDWVVNEAYKALNCYGLKGVSFGRSINIVRSQDWGQQALEMLPFFRNYVEKLSRARGTGQGAFVSTSSGGWTLSGDEFTCLLSCSTRRISYICSYDQVLMWKDMLWARVNTYVAAECIYGTPTMISALGQCLDWCFSCLEKYGNAGYELLKNIESLAKTNLVALTDPVFGEAGTHDKMIEVVRTKERSMSGSESPLTDALVGILANDRPLSESVELFGIQKISGHPCVDPVSGGSKVRGIACTPKEYDPERCQRVRNNFCRMYCEGYVRRRSRWPPLVFPREARSTRLYQLYTLQETRLTFKSYPISDWDRVRFAKHHDFEYYPNFTDLMDDKAISLYRDQVSYTWRRGVTPRSNKRLLLEMLSKQEISVREVVDLVRTGILPFSWFVVSLYPKEREFKLQPRMFSMLVFEMRVFFTAMEANVADNVFPYLPPQTMTLPKQEIVERFHEVTWDPQGSNLMRLYGEFDIESWNINFQAPLMDPILRDIGDMHGEDNVFTTLHHFFSKCVVVVRVADNEPENIEAAQVPGASLQGLESDLMWENHLAGMEGLGQKPWTIATYAMMDLAMQKFPISYHLIGQADNQIFVALLDCSGHPDPPQYAREVADDLVNEVDKECRAVGHSTKKEECMLSSTVVTYSKDVYIRGVEYHTSLKALSRVFPNSASDFPAINNSVSAISGQCRAAAERMKNPLIVYRIWAFHCAWYLCHLRVGEPVESVFLGKDLTGLLTKDAIRTLMLLPGDLGGLTILPFTTLLYKGGGDPLSVSYASLSLLSHVSKKSRKLLSALHEGRWFWKDPELADILNDPYSLPLMRARTPEMAVQRDGIEAIRGLAENKEIREICGEDVTAFEEDLILSLQSVRPFNPALLSDLLGDSVAGVKRQVAKMFITTRTVQGLLQRSADVNTCRAILAAGAGYAISSIRRITTLRQTEVESRSIFREVETLRGWWAKNTDISIVGVTTVTPFDSRPEFHQEVKNTEGVKAVRTVPRGTDPCFDRGNETPYLGRPTVEKRSVHGYRIVASSAPERAVARLSRLATQPGVGKTMEDLVGDVCLTRADVDFSELIKKLGRSYGGTIDHRYTSLMGQRGAGYIGGTAFPSQVILSSDNAPPISGGEEDYPLMVQEWLICATSFLYHASLDSDRYRMCSIDVSRCNVPPLADQIMEVSRPLTGRVVSLRNNNMAYAPAIYIQRLITSYPSTLVGCMSSLELTSRRSALPLRRMIRSSLTSSRSAAAVADRGAGVIHLSLDLLEVRGFGLKKVFVTAGLEIARFAVEAIYARAQDEIRWSPVPLIMSLAESVAKSLSGVFIHPLFKNDPLVVNQGLSTPLRYNMAGTSSVSRVRNWISAVALESLSDPRSMLYSSPGCLFGDDREGEAVREILSQITLCFHMAMLLGEVRIQEIYSVLRQKLPQEMRRAANEEEQLVRLEILVGRLLTWSHTGETTSLYERFSKLSRGRLVLRTDTPVREALREARRYEAPPGWVAPSVNLKYTPFPSVHPLLEEDCVIKIGSPLTSCSWSIPISARDIDIFSAYRLRGRAWGRESSAGYSYTGITDLTRDACVVSVGCGYGSGAAVMLVSGASVVLGLDLDTDLDAKAVVAGSLVPPAVTYTGMDSRFIRYPPGEPGGGDFMDARTVRKCRDIAGPSAIIVVDIPIITKQCVESLLSSLSSYGRECLWAVRIIHRARAIAELFLSLQESCEEIAVRSVFERDGIAEAWLIGRSRRTLSLVPRVARQPPPLPSIEPSDIDIKLLGGGRKYLLRTVLSSCGLGSIVERKGYIDRMTRLLNASIGEQEHRFTYKQWTDVLHTLAMLTILESDSPLEEALAVRSEQQYTIDLGDRQLEVIATRSLIRSLTRILPRLL